MFSVAYWLVSYLIVNLVASELRDEFKLDGTHLNLTMLFFLQGHLLIYVSFSLCWSKGSSCSSFFTLIFAWHLNKILVLQRFNHSGGCSCNGSLAERKKNIVKCYWIENKIVSLSWLISAIILQIHLKLSWNPNAIVEQGFLLIEITYFLLVII
jgi:hypothetical protein